MNVISGYFKSRKKIKKELECVQSHLDFYRERTSKLCDERNNLNSIIMDKNTRLLEMLDEIDNLSNENSRLTEKIKVLEGEVYNNAKKNNNI